MAARSQSAAGLPIEALLVDMLKGIYMGCPDRHEARRLADRLVGVAWHTERKKGEASSPVSHDAIDGLEVVVAKVRELAGHHGIMKVDDAKRWLRNIGPAGAGLAAQLGKLSKVRNAQGHPAAHQLVVAIEQALMQQQKPAEVKAEQEEEVENDMANPDGKQAKSPTDFGNHEQWEPPKTPMQDMVRKQCHSHTSLAVLPEKYIMAEKADPPTRSDDEFFGKPPQPKKEPAQCTPPPPSLRQVAECTRLETPLPTIAEIAKLAANGASIVVLRAMMEKGKLTPEQTADFEEAFSMLFDKDGFIKDVG